MAYEKGSSGNEGGRSRKRSDKEIAEEKKFAYSVVKRITRSIIRMLQN